MLSRWCRRGCEEVLLLSRTLKSSVYTLAYIHQRIYAIVYTLAYIRLTSSCEKVKTTWLFQRIYAYKTEYTRIYAYIGLRTRIYAKIRVYTRITTADPTPRFSKFKVLHNTVKTKKFCAPDLSNKRGKSSVETRLREEIHEMYAGFVTMSKKSFWLFVCFVEFRNQ
jgi:hypothetical protein